MNRFVAMLPMTLGLVAAFGGAGVVASCTGQQTASGVEVVRGGASLVPAPAGPLVAIAAEKLDAAVAAYLEQHPEKLNTKWGLEEWGSVIGLGVFGGGLRRKATDLVAKMAGSKLQNSVA